MIVGLSKLQHLTLSFLKYKTIDVNDKSLGFIKTESRKNVWSHIEKLE